MKGKNKTPWELFLDGEKDLREPNPSSSSSLTLPYKLLSRLPFIPSTATTTKTTVKSTELENILSKATRNESASKALYEMSQYASLTFPVVVQALQHGADLHWTSPLTGQCALHHLAALGQHYILRKLCRLKSISFSMKDHENRTPLMTAVLSMHSNENRRDRVIKVLIQRRDCALDELDSQGHSALYHAWEKKDIRSIRRLLLAKASVWNCVMDLAEQIPLLYELLTFLREHRLQSNHIAKITTMLTHVIKPKALESFFSAVALHPQMVDIYSLSVWTLPIKVTLLMSKQQLADGMILFGLREELRAMKKWSMHDLLPANPVTVVDMGIDEIEVEMGISSPSPEPSIEVLHSRRQAVRARKLAEGRRKREAREEMHKLAAREAERSRIEKQFPTTLPKRRIPRPSSSENEELM
eukprot:gene8619-9498_t